MNNKGIRPKVNDHPTIDDIRRLEEKIDMVIKFFNIGGVPRRSKQEIDQVVDKKIFNLNRRIKKRNRKE